MEGGNNYTACMKRLMADLRSLEKDPPVGVSGSPRESNIKIWDAIIFGPIDTEWDGGMFKLTLEFRDDYPNTPPKVTFVSNIFHPNVNSNGGLCVDILQKKWNPVYDVAAVLTSVQSLLCDPNPNSPLNEEAARLYLTDLQEYKRRVHRVVQESLSDV